MQVCIELGTDFYLQAFRNRVMAVPLGLCDLSALAQGAVPDSLQFGAASVSGPGQISVPITAAITSDALLGAAASGAAPADATTQGVVVQLSLSTTTSSPGPGKASLTLKVAYAGATAPGGGALPPALQKLIDQLGATLATSVSSDITALNSALGLDGAALPSSAIGLSASAAALAILLDWDGVGPFSGGAIAGGLVPGVVSAAPGENLALMLSSDIVSGPVVKALQHTFTGDLELDSALTPQWSETPGRANVHFGFQGTKKGGCKLPVVDWGLKDISFDATVDVAVTLPPAAAGGGTTLETDGAFDFTLHPEDVIECVIILGGLAGVAGALAGFAVGGPVGSVMGGAAAAAVGAVGVLVSAATTSASPTLPGNCTSSSDGKSFTCTTALPPLCFAGPPLTFSRLSGPLSGPGGAALVLHGVVTPPAPAAQPSIQGVAVGDWATNISGSCNAGFYIISTRTITLTFDPPPQTISSAPCAPVPGAAAGINICPPIFIGQAGIPPLQQLYSASVVQDAVARTAQITVAFTQDAAAVTYPCILRLLTTAGARQFDLGDPPTLTPMETQGLDRVRIIRVAACEQLVTGWHGIPGVFDPYWLVDPPPEESAVHLWETAVTGVNPGVQITLEGAAGGETLVHAVVDRSGAAELGAMLAPVAPTGDIVLRRAGREPAAASNVFAMQTVLLPQGGFSVPAPVTSLRLALVNGQEAAIVGQGEAAMAVSLQTPGEPLLIEAGPAAALAERLGLRLGAVVACGDVGVRLGPGPELTWLGLSGVTAAVEAGRTLVVQRGDTIEALRLSRDGRITPVAAIAAAGRALFRAAGVSPLPRVFLRAREGGGEVLAVGGGDAPFRPLARYRRDPWFLNAARSAAWLVRAGHGAEVTVHRVLAVGRSSLMPPAPDGAAA